MNDFDKAVAEIAELTEYNNHIEAKIAVCNLLGSGADMLKARFEALKVIMDIEGCLAPELTDYNYGLYKKLIRFAELNLSAVKFRKVYNAL